jgi:hypothetical protein
MSLKKKNLSMVMADQKCCGEKPAKKTKQGEQRKD